jgi:hypothetical protein
MWQTIETSLAQNATSLITMGGAINPYVGGVVSLIVVGLLIFAGIKAAQAAWAQQQANSGQVIGGGTGNDQNVTNDVQNGTNNWINSGGTTTDAPTPPTPTEPKKPA